MEKPPNRGIDKDGDIDVYTYKDCCIDLGMHPCQGIGGLHEGSMQRYCIWGLSILYPGRPGIWTAQRDC